MFETIVKLHAIPGEDRYQIGRSNCGEWYAVSGDTPVFCIVAPTEEEAHERAKKAFEDFSKLGVDDPQNGA